MSAATVTGRYVSIKSGNVTAAKIFRHTEQRICFHSLIVVISPRMNTVRQRFKRLCPMEESTVSTSAPFANLNIAYAKQEKAINKQHIGSVCESEYGGGDIYNYAYPRKNRGRSNVHEHIEA